MGLIMKKIKKRSRTGSREWHLYVLEPPTAIDPQGMTTLVMLLDPRSGDFADFLPLPRPVEVEEVVNAVEEAYRFQPLNKRPGKIKVMAKPYLEGLQASSILSSVDISGERNPEFEKELKSFLKSMPEKLSEGAALGIGPRREEFLALCIRLFALKPWLHLLDEEVLTLDVEGKPLKRPVVSTMGLMGQLRGFAFFHSLDEFDAFTEQAELGLTEELVEFDQFMVSFDAIEEFDPLARLSYERRGWEAGLGFIPWVSVHEPGREKVWIDEEAEADEILWHLEVLANCLEDIASRDYPPYPELAGETRVGEHKVTIGLLERSVEQFEADLEILNENGSAGPDEKILRIRVALDDIEPPIYRVVEVPDHLTMAGLHDVIQRSMGWENRNLWSFHYKGKDYTLLGDEELGAFEEVDATITTIKEAIGSRSKNFTYTYDYLDSWHHTLRVESRTAPEKGVSYPRVVEGARACPPEGAGGTDGYYEALEALAVAEPGDEILDWLGDYDPEYFDLTKVELPRALMLNRAWLYQEQIPEEMLDAPNMLEPEIVDALKALLYEIQTRDLEERIVEADDAALGVIAEELFALDLPFNSSGEILLLLGEVREFFSQVSPG